MSFGEKALASGGIAGGAVFTACCFIPFVGGLVGLVAGGATFLVVEAGALVGYGAYKAGSGIAHGVKHLRDRHHHDRDHDHDHHQKQGRFHRHRKKHDAQVMVDSHIHTYVHAEPDVIPGINSQPTDSYAAWLQSRTATNMNSNSGLSNFGVYQTRTTPLSSFENTSVTNAFSPRRIS